MLFYRLYRADTTDRWKPLISVFQSVENKEPARLPDMGENTAQQGWTYKVKMRIISA